MASSAASSGTPASFIARRHFGCPSRAPSGITNSRVPVTPRITETRSREIGFRVPGSGVRVRPSELGTRDPKPDFSSANTIPASISACLAATRPRSCEVSVASMSRGAMPNSSGLKSTGDRNPPRRA